MSESHPLSTITGRMLSSAAAWRRVGGDMLYPSGYAWVVFFCAVDAMMTWIILELGGSELNGVAAAVIQWGGLWAMLAFKFGLAVIAIVCCEEVGRRRYRTGRRLCRCLVAVAAMPVVAVGIQLAVFGAGP